MLETYLTYLNFKLMIFLYIFGQKFAKTLTNRHVEHMPEKRMCDLNCVEFL